MAAPSPADLPVKPPENRATRHTQSTRVNAYERVNPGMLLMNNPLGTTKRLATHTELQPRTHGSWPRVMPSCRILRRGHYGIATDTPDRHRLRIAFDDLAVII